MRHGVLCSEPISCSTVLAPPRFYRLCVAGIAGVPKRKTLAETKKYVMIERGLPVRLQLVMYWYLRKATLTAAVNRIVYRTPTPDLAVPRERKLRRPHRSPFRPPPLRRPHRSPCRPLLLTLSRKKESGEGMKSKFGLFASNQNGGTDYGSVTPMELVDGGET
ncbi:CCCH-type zinc fingerfamily protein with RNA-binding domain-containing protein [Actinidia rufa]|uniref:CCCH-type zinc fingerfamily protein with RNA-binding domain-containing protein n=1 Tax=Actinidia rufa TaxID=165716 RepID=A0A7J0HA04_9ERIC|nr:CCCH-type zinc fingerfamily protein with RNA-binding domain-containing protein [Actinidia rufa]